MTKCPKHHEIYFSYILACPTCKLIKEFNLNYLVSN